MPVKTFFIFFSFIFRPKIKDLKRLKSGEKKSLSDVKYAGIAMLILTDHQGYHRSDSVKCSVYAKMIKISTAKSLNPA